MEQDEKVQIETIETIEEITEEDAVLLITTNLSKAIRTLLITDSQDMQFDELVAENLLITFNAPYTTKEIQSCQKMALLEIVSNK